MPRGRSSRRIVFLLLLLGVYLSTLSTSPASARAWVRAVDGAVENVVSGEPTLDGRFVVAAQADDATDDSRVVKVNVDGSVLWECRIAGDSAGGPVRDMAEAADGTLYLAGTFAGDVWAPGSDRTAGSCGSAASAGRASTRPRRCSRPPTVERS